MRNSGRSSSAVEIGFSIVGIDRISLAIWLAVVVDDVDVGAGDDQLQVALAVVLEEPVADVRLIGEDRADRELQVLLRRLALRFVDEVDDQRRLARLVVFAAENLAAENQRRANLGHAPAACPRSRG